MPFHNALPIKRTSLFVFPLLSTLFCFSMFYRITNAVIAPDLVRDFNLDAEKLGMLGSAFFYAFALFQIPIGILLDRIEARWVISFFTLVGARGPLFLHPREAISPHFSAGYCSASVWHRYSWGV